MCCGAIVRDYQPTGGRVPDQPCCGAQRGVAADGGAGGAGKCADCRPLRRPVPLCAGAGGRARDILEVGTATGYSGLWLGLAAHARRGRLVGLEQDEARAALAEAFWRQADMAGTCHVHRGEAFAALAEMTDELRLHLCRHPDLAFKRPEQADQLSTSAWPGCGPAACWWPTTRCGAAMWPTRPTPTPASPPSAATWNAPAAHPDLATTVVPLRDGVCHQRAPAGAGALEG